MKKLTKKERQEYIDRIWENIHGDGLYGYRDLIESAVKCYVGKWDDEDLLDWCGEKDIP